MPDYEVIADESRAGVVGSGMRHTEDRSSMVPLLMDLGIVLAAFVLAWAARSLVLPKLLPTFFETSLYPLGSYV